MNDKARKFTNRREAVWMVQFAVALGALMTTPMAASAQTDTETGRIHITFQKADSGTGSGYLFYQGQKYGLAITGPEIKKIWVTSIDLIGTASNLHSPADIIGTYDVRDPAAAIVKRERLAHLENKKGVVLEIRAVNLNRWLSLNLSAITVKNLGWQPASQ
jgi:hypothetical protein